MNLGVMQSRLSPINTKIAYQYWPSEWWQNEFSLAKIHRFNHIEWIYDTNPDNCLNTDAGISTVLGQILNNLVRVEAICADYFIDNPIWDDSLQKDNIRTLNRLIVAAFKLGAKNIVIPCLDNSAFTRVEQFKATGRCIKAVLDVADRYMINLCVECNLAPAELKDLLHQAYHPRFGVCLDTGNLVAAGQDLLVVNDYIGHVKHVHLKDSISKIPGNVETGTGSVDFALVFNMLRQVEYDGPYTLQCSRGNEYDLDLVYKQAQFIKGIYG